MTVQAFLDTAEPKGWNGLRPYAKCADGTCFSIQTGAETPYRKRYSDIDENTVEVACLPEPALQEYGDLGGFLSTDHLVYGYVPISMLDQVLTAHGGIIGIATNEEMWGASKCEQ